MAVVAAPGYTLRLSFVAAILALLPFGALSDQHDLRLGPLFDELQETSNAMAARQAEQQIWRIWHEPPNAGSMAIMQAARRALDDNDLPASLRLLDELVAQAPGYAEAWNQRAIVRFLASDYGGALEDIERVVELEPRHFGALSGRGQIYMQLNEPEPALAAFEMALAHNPWMDGIREQLELLKALINSRQRPI